MPGFSGEPLRYPNGQTRRDAPKPDVESEGLRRCRKCGKGLFQNHYMIGRIEIACGRCKTTNIFESETGIVPEVGTPNPVIAALQARVNSLIDKPAIELAPDKVFEQMEERWAAFLKRKRRERLEVATGLRFDVFKRDGFRCQYCGRGVQEVLTLHVDHVVPRSKGGQDLLDNLVTACSTCNLGKSDKEL